MKIEQIFNPVIMNKISLNPYCNGMKIEQFRYGRSEERRCLNPYCNGMKIEPIKNKQYEYK